MNIAIICFSLTGWETGRCLKKGFESEGDVVTLAGKSRYLSEGIKESTGQWAGKRFSDSDAIVFVGACGIAVRSIAPYIQKKTKDPAVLVVDECGKFVISLLSGHLGGANALTLKAAEILEAEPVVTTATDLHNRFAVDVFAKKNDCKIFNMKAAKEVSAALLAGKNVGFFSDFPWEGELPKGLVLCEGTEKNLPETGVVVSVYKNRKLFKETVSIVPPAVVLGMGCRKGKDTKSVNQAAKSSLEEAGVYQKAVACIASIDIKKEEEAFLMLAEEWGIPFLTYTGEELLCAPGKFTPSSFVRTVTGVDNVCERSAVLGAEKGVLIQKKKGENGVTTALALKDWRIHFE